MKRFFLSLVTGLLLTVSAFAQVPIYTRGAASSASSVSPSAFPLLATDGSCTTPSYAFSAATNWGLARDASNGLFWCIGGTAIGALGGTSMLLAASTTLSWNSGVLSGPPSIDTGLARDGVGIMALKNGNAAMESRVYAGNGGFMSQVKSVTESLTIAAAATTVGATSIPAGAILLAVSVRVTTVIPTAATFTYATTVGGTALNTAAVSSALNSTDPGTAAGASYRAAATTVTITPNATPGAATGAVRLQYYYLQVTPPTS